MTDFRLYDDPGADVAQIVTDGATIKPFLNALSPIVSEAKLHVTEDGLHVRVVDSANVCMADVSLAAEAFDTYDLADGEAVLGLPIKEAQSLVRRARKRSDDTLTLSVQERELTATVARGYDDHNVVSNGTMDLIDPDAVRAEPDIPELDRDVSVSVGADAFTDALSYATGVTDYVSVAVKGVNQHTNALYLGGETDTRAESAAIDGIDTDAVAESLYSKGYLTSALSALSGVDAETVSLKFSTEFPITIGAEEESFSVEYTIAPRIQSD